MINSYKIYHNIFGLLFKLLNIISSTDLINILFLQRGLQDQELDKVLFESNNKVGILGLLKALDDDNDYFQRSLGLTVSLLIAALGRAYNNINKKNE
jgi:hypothetical protein